MFITWINNICEMPLATCVVGSHYMRSPSCYLGRYHIIFESTSIYDIVFGPIIPMISYLDLNLPMISKLDLHVHLPMISYLDLHLPMIS